MSRLIDADKLKEGVSSYHFKNLIDDQPTVDAEPIRHGHWVSRIRIYECSECGFAGYPEMNYCPWCGTSMDLVDRESEE